MLLGRESRIAYQIQDKRIEAVPKRVPHERDVLAASRQVKSGPHLGDGLVLGARGSAARTRYGQTNFQNCPLRNHVQMD